jgi:energy-converting hydrogenase A subunit M
MTLMTLDSKLLNRDEKEVLSLLAQAWDLYSSLPEHHSSDTQAFIRAIHAAMTIAMARPVGAEFAKQKKETGMPHDDTK